MLCASARVRSSYCRAMYWLTAACELVSDLRISSLMNQRLTAQTMSTKTIAPMVTNRP